ncbi:MAG: WG repeat-containing protein [Defluviitaleaceae bacterium]|nr:WG repeat-containing protein [Defluviitaleaceae bacterium]
MKYLYLTTLIGVFIILTACGANDANDTAHIAQKTQPEYVYYIQPQPESPRTYAGLVWLVEPTLSYNDIEHYIDPNLGEPLLFDPNHRIFGWHVFDVEANATIYFNRHMSSHYAALTIVERAHSTRMGDWARQFFISGRSGKYAMVYGSRLATNFVFDFLQFIDSGNAVAKINGYYGILNVRETVYASVGMVLEPFASLHNFNGFVWFVEPTLNYDDIAHYINPNLGEPQLFDPNSNALGWQALDVETDAWLHFNQQTAFGYPIFVAVAEMAHRTQMGTWEWRFLNTNRTGKYAMMHNNQPVTEFVFDFFQFISNSKAVVKINGHYGILDIWDTLFVRTGVSRVILPEPVQWENGWVWRVLPNLPYERVIRCICGLYFDTDIWNVTSISPHTGLLTEIYHNGHGGGSSGWVYDIALGLFGNPMRSFVYGTHIGMHPLNDFENSVLNMYLELFGAEYNFDDWVLADLRRALLGGSIIVQSVDSTNRIYWEWEYTPNFVSEYRLEDEAFLGEFAIMHNMEFVTDFIFDDAYWGFEFIGASIEGVWGVIDHHGNALLDFQFQHVLPICDNTAFVKYNGYYGILDITLTLQGLQ